MPARKADELLGACDNGALLRRTCNSDPATAPKLEQAAAAALSVYIIEGGGPAVSRSYAKARVTLRIRLHPQVNGLAARGSNLFVSSAHEDATFSWRYRIDMRTGRITRFAHAPLTERLLGRSLILGQDASLATTAAGSKWIATEGGQGYENTMRVRRADLASGKQAWRLHLRFGHDRGAFYPLGIHFSNGSLWLVTASEDEDGWRVWRIDPNAGRVRSVRHINRNGGEWAPVWRGHQVWLTSLGSVYRVHLP